MRTLTCMVMVSLHMAAIAQVIGVAPSSAVVYGGSSEVLLFSGATVSNLSDVPQYVRCTRVEVDVVPGSENAFAWTSSMPPGAATDPNPRMIMELGSSNDLQGVYFPNGAEGTSVIRYCFYTELDMSDSACIDVSYIAVGTGIGEAPGPRLWMRHDPGNDLLLFGGDPVGPIDVWIVDVTGRTMRSIRAGTNSALDLSGLPPGAYVARIRGVEELRPLRFLKG